MPDDVLGILEQIAETGHAPDEGCSRFGVGYEAAFERLRKTYLRSAFGRGRSAEKFVIGPFGSGKTHFLRQLMEVAREEGCATAEVRLNRDIDFTKTIQVYREVAREIRAPGQSARGIQGLLELAVRKVGGSLHAQSEVNEKLVAVWIAGLDQAEFADKSYARVLMHALEAQLAGETAVFEQGCRWLAGEVSDRTLVRDLPVSVLSQAEQNRFGRLALLSLCQFVHHAQFTGTVIGFDEAEQGFDVGRRQMTKILSMLKSSMDATADLRHGSALIVYALTPDLVERIEEFPALQQRVADPGPDQGFFDGNTRAPKIDLTKRDDPLTELQAMGRAFVELLYEAHGSDLNVSKEATLDRILGVASDVAETDAAASSRRTMAKRCCSILVNLYDNGTLDLAGDSKHPGDEPEV